MKDFCWWVCSRKEIKKKKKKIIKNCLQQNIINVALDLKVRLKKRLFVLLSFMLCELLWKGRFLSSSLNQILCVVIFHEKVLMKSCIWIVDAFLNFLFYGRGINECRREMKTTKEWNHINFFGGNIKLLNMYN